MIALLLASAALALPPAASAEQFPDVRPQPLRSVFKVPDPELLYMPDDPDWECEKPCPEPTADDFPRVVEGKLALPKRYDEAKLAPEDRALLERSLAAAHRYADVNNAAADGYAFQDRFVPGMGIHMNNLSRILSGEMDVAKPQFLTYTRDRRTGAYQLIQLGYIRRRQMKEGSFPLFKDRAAGGHFHPEDWCVKVVDGVFIDSVAPCKKGETHVGPIWMMHVSVNMYGQEGMFSDYFSCANHLSRTGRQYTFFGKVASQGRPAPPRRAGPGKKGSGPIPADVAKRKQAHDTGHFRAGAPGHEHHQPSSPCGSMR